MILICITRLCRSKGTTARADPVRDESQTATRTSAGTTHDLPPKTQSTAAVGMSEHATLMFCWNLLYLKRIVPEGTSSGGSYLSEEEVRKSEGDRRMERGQLRQVTIKIRTSSTLIRRRACQVQHKNLRTPICGRSSKQIRFLRISQHNHAGAVHGGRASWKLTIQPPPLVSPA